MDVLYELGKDINSIKEALDSIEVKGHVNISLMHFVFGKCDSIVEKLNGLYELTKENQNGSAEVKVGANT